MDQTWVAVLLASVVGFRMEMEFFAPSERSGGVFCVHLGYCFNGLTKERFDGHFTHPFVAFGYDIAVRLVSHARGVIERDFGERLSRHGDALIAAGIKPVSPWEFLQHSGVVVDQAWAELLAARTGCSAQFWLNMQEGYENGKA